LSGGLAPKQSQHGTKPTLFFVAVSGSFAYLHHGKSWNKNFAECPESEIPRAI
jgi:hypothetical protein